MSTVFRTSTPTPVPATNGGDVEANEYGAEINIEGLEPIEFREERAGNIVLEALGIEDDLGNLPQDEQAKVDDIRRHIVEMLRKEGKEETVESFKDTLNSLKEDMGLPEDAAPDKFIERLGSVIRAWRELSFIKDPKDRREIFMELAKLDTQAEVNRKVIDLMEDYQIWQ